MIRHEVTEIDLVAAVERRKPGWSARAAERTRKFGADQRYDETSSIWRDVKAVYMELQHMKCAFCERKLESLKRGGAIEQDVEHFRPKSSVRYWEPSDELKQLGISPTAVPPGPTGYYKLPYHLFNYAASCKPCNTILKKDHFPIAGSYHFAADDPAECGSELAYLIYPMGSVDDDPQSLIRFHGASPMPCADRGFNRERALVTIEFFRLDDASDRDGLYHGRSLVICGLFPVLKEKFEAGGMKGAKEHLANLAKTIPHLNCALSFGQLFLSDPDEAKRIYDYACAFVFAKS